MLLSEITIGSEEELEEMEAEDLFTLPYIRLSVIEKLNEAIQMSGLTVNNSIGEIERYIFEKAISQTGYLNHIARIILYFQKQGLKKKVADIPQPLANPEDMNFNEIVEIITELWDSE